MSKYHRIKWRESDEQELKRLVKNFNAKLARLEKKNPQSFKSSLPKGVELTQKDIENALPKFWDRETETFTNRISVKQLKELINTRQDLKREMNALKRFTKRGAEELVIAPNIDNNLILTKWQRKEMLTRSHFINKRREKRRTEIENLELESRGEKLGYTNKDFGMGKIHLKELEPINPFTPKMENYSLKHKWRSIMHQSQLDYFNAKDYQLRENFIQGLEENYNPKDIKEVVKAIRDMDIEKFLNEFYKDPNAFEWAYPPDEEEYKGYLSQLKSAWMPTR